MKAQIKTNALNDLVDVVVSPLTHEIKVLLKDVGFCTMNRTAAIHLIEELIKCVEFLDE